MEHHLDNKGYYMAGQETESCFPEVGSSQADLQNVLNTLSTGILLLQVNGEIVLMNRAARSILESKDWLHLSDRRLRVRAERSDDVETRMQLALERQSPDVVSRVLLRGKDSSDSLLLAFTSLSTGGYGGAQNTAKNTAICVVVDPNLDKSADATILKCLYALTDAESNVAALLAMGLDYSEVAECRNIAVSTVRSYTKTIFKKLRVNSRAGVVRKVNATSIPLDAM
ncbi:hypothetical protein AB833_01440 [Chromatiales bacterium (ex Bugula neritina AB1)]|nr:hypothetical protein AB833_01440 [Chromatiales bacterium (ex Bugula neritina AB1)]